MIVRGLRSVCIGAIDQMSRRRSRDFRSWLHHHWQMLPESCETGLECVVQNKPSDAMLAAVPIRIIKVVPLLETNFILE